MKKFITAFKLSFVLLLCTLFTNNLLAKNNDPNVEKKKTYNKTYPLATNQKVSIKNSFGNVTINNYDGAEVKVEVTITVKASSEEKAQKIIDKINIVDNAAETISFETVIKNNNNNNGNQSMSIDYIVYLPQANPLKIQNEFGKTFVGDRTGIMDIIQKFGDLTVGSLSNVNLISVEFGGIKADKIVNGKTNFAYSKVDIKSFAGTVKSSFEFCSKSKIVLTNDVTDVNISNSYSDIDINIPPTFNGTYNIHTSFATFKDNVGFKIKDVDEEEKSPKFDFDYAGISGTGSCKVKIKISFGKVKFN